MGSAGIWSNSADGGNTCVAVIISTNGSCAYCIGSRRRCCQWCGTTLELIRGDSTWCCCTSQYYVISICWTAHISRNCWCRWFVWKEHKTNIILFLCFIYVCQYYLIKHMSKFSKMIFLHFMLVYTHMKLRKKFCKEIPKIEKSTALYT